MIGQMAIAVALPGFNTAWTFGEPYFSFDGSFFPPISLRVSKTKNEENLSIRSLNFRAN